MKSVGMDERFSPSAKKGNSCSLFMRIAVFNFIASLNHSNTSINSPVHLLFFVALPPNQVASIVAMHPSKRLAKTATPPVLPAPSSLVLPPFSAGISEIAYICCRTDLNDGFISMFYVAGESM